MPVSLNPSMVQGVVIAIIVFLIQLLFLEFLVLANANMQREISDHCDFGNFTTIRLRNWESLSVKPSYAKVYEAYNKDGGCIFRDKSGAEAPTSTPHTSNNTYYSEDGNPVEIGGADGDTAGIPKGTNTWKGRPEIVNQFHGIISIIGEIIPLLLVVAVASEAFMLVYLRNSQGGISGVVSSRVALLVIAYVVILFGGTVFEFAENALQVFTSTAVSGTDRFRDIAQLLLSLVPLAYELLVLGILGWNTASAYRAVRSRFARSGNNRMRSIGQGM